MPPRRSPRFVPGSSSSTTLGLALSLPSRRSSEYSHASSIDPSTDGLVTIPLNNSGNGAIVQVERILESIVEAVLDGSEITIPYRSIHADTRRGHSESPANQNNARQAEILKFPGRNIHEVGKFGMAN
ncbi:hypothetical protein B0H66DRAFT_145209 [Apodospora peruviana]|uniref:Uncharacterized protein n=1 Tax=Apodospora peruviana TaxID=516989 RepID=A0AAE0IJM3_9PEZI|nr:hypothetical protein B0H66DRAFT_145209 [Apodospora peruviana]